MKCNGTRAETRFRLSAKRTNPFKLAGGASIQSTTGSRGVRIGGSNAGYTTFRGSVKSIGYPLHSPVSPSLPLPCVTVCHHISTGLYLRCVISGLLCEVAENCVLLGCYAASSKKLPLYDFLWVITQCYNSEAGELPTRKHTTFRTRRKFAIKNYQYSLCNNLEEHGARVPKTLTVTPSGFTYTD